MDLKPQIIKNSLTERGKTKNYSFVRPSKTACPVRFPRISKDVRDLKLREKIETTKSEMGTDETRENTREMPATIVSHKR